MLLQASCGRLERPEEAVSVCSSQLLRLWTASGSQPTQPEQRAWPELQVCNSAQATLLIFGRKANLLMGSALS